MYLISKLPLAKKDLKGIWHYSYQKWGEKQANNYLMELGRGIDLLIENPEMGHICPYANQYRQYLINHHIVFYRIERDKCHLVIVRVLHERMEPKQHL